jgi:hypothetical protein
VCAGKKAKSKEWLLRLEARDRECGVKEEVQFGVGSQYQGVDRCAFEQPNPFDFAFGLAVVSANASRAFTLQPISGVGGRDAVQQSNGRFGAGSTFLGANAPMSILPKGWFVPVDAVQKPDNPIGAAFTSLSTSNTLAL